MTEERNSSEKRSSLNTPKIMLGQLKKQFSSRRIIMKPNNQSFGENTPGFRSESITQEICKCPEILIVDDDSFNIIALENILCSLGYSVESCFNGQEAVDAMTERSQNKCGRNCVGYKIIFLDCNMPIMDGYEAATTL
mmetsp:Transcript_1739/g.1599  ORF Transcript_1739/g.1599 Transcript_1739/m.1599 type:complete len:138 (+) Transcript_1739:2916-3329(+)|eukprot:CAMPEP_0114580818 /NCGR_PEP_ID=MMETSP0125-20121206/5015_1 /TAXON_ID=485358 ORGANISM="Aristerostoma sp., Strain ATCC 50986" /NCGR_SAMPLE_ID=MMETSP0125 /ASSEMBLY_ACC=CAM_ASM_000245 /LENGTH=137 /DNA_ID=CAMNT_0001772583 /DNA_START=2802 /DNA_END=3215 /DNA_ORIENTATION=-